jgi:CDP-diacylglycerol--glycerol-3-phosphate 3-phosphatidyltransferase
MTLANKITFLRVILSPVFFFVYFLPEWFSFPSVAAAVMLILLFVIIELTDLFDGMVARSRNEVSDTGKILDPFADSFSRLTYFICFAGSGFMPLWAFLLIMYRDLAVAFIRQLVSRKGVSMPARLSGKMKAWFYALSGIGGLAVYAASAFSVSDSVYHAVYTAAYVSFVVSAAVAVWTLADYSRVLKD